MVSRPTTESVRPQGRSATGAKLTVDFFQTIADLQEMFSSNVQAGGAWGTRQLVCGLEYVACCLRAWGAVHAFCFFSRVPFAL